MRTIINQYLKHLLGSHCIPNRKTCNCSRILRGIIVCKKTGCHIVQGMFFQIGRKCLVINPDRIGRHHYITRRIPIIGSKIEGRLQITNRSLVKKESRHRKNLPRKSLKRLLPAQHIHKSQAGIRVMIDTRKINSIAIQLHIKFYPAPKRCLLLCIILHFSHIK